VKLPDGIDRKPEPWSVNESGSRQDVAAAGGVAGTVELEPAGEPLGGPAVLLPHAVVAKPINRATAPSVAQCPVCNDFPYTDNAVSVGKVS
jgi:hypothetical protein